jgi:hypothetical protein
MQMQPAVDLQDTAEIQRLTRLLSLSRDQSHSATSLSDSDRQRCLVMLQLAEQTRRLGRPSIIQDFIRAAVSPDHLRQLKQVQTQDCAPVQTVDHPVRSSASPPPLTPPPRPPASECQLQRAIWDYIEKAEEVFTSTTIPSHARHLQRREAGWWLSF